MRNSELEVKPVSKMSLVQIKILYAVKIYLGLYLRIYCAFDITWDAKEPGGYGVWVPGDKWWCGGWQRPSTAVISSWSDGWMYSNILFPVSSTCSTYICVHECGQLCMWSAIKPQVMQNAHPLLITSSSSDVLCLMYRWRAVLPGTGRGGLMLFQRYTWFCHQRQQQTQSHLESKGRGNTVLLNTD